MSIPIGAALIAVTSIADAINTILERYGRGEMTDEQFIEESERVIERVTRAEAIMAAARAARGD